MTRTPKPRLGTKKYVRQLAKFDENVRDVLARYHARPHLNYGERVEREFVVQTPAGQLWVSLGHNHPTCHPSIMQRFDDPERAKAFAGNFGSMLNTYTGKWNFHFSIRWVDEVGEAWYLGWWSTQFEWLMEQPPVPAPTERYEVVRVSDGRVLANRLPSLADANKQVDDLITSDEVQPHAAALFPPDRAAYLTRKQPTPDDAHVSGLGCYFEADRLKHQKKDVRISKN